MKKKSPTLRRLKIMIFFIGLIFAFYSFAHYLMEIIEMENLVTGGTFRRIAPEYEDQWLEVNTVLNLLDIKLMLAFIALILWVYVWRK